MNWKQARNGAGASCIAYCQLALTASLSLSLSLSLTLAFSLVPTSLPLFLSPALSHRLVASLPVCIILHFRLACLINCRLLPSPQPRQPLYPCPPAIRSPYAYPAPIGAALPAPFSCLCVFSKKCCLHLCAAVFRSAAIRIALRTVASPPLPGTCENSDSS